MAQVKGTTDFDYVIPVSVTKRRKVSVETEPTTDKEVQNIHSYDYYNNNNPLTYSL